MRPNRPKRGLAPQTRVGGPQLLLGGEKICGSPPVSTKDFVNPLRAFKVGVSYRIRAQMVFSWSVSMNPKKLTSPGEKNRLHRDPSLTKPLFTSIFLARPVVVSLFQYTTTKTVALEPVIAQTGELPTPRAVGDPVA